MKRSLARPFSFLLVLVVCLATSQIALADLTPQLGGQVMFDDDLDIVYLSDMGLGLSEDFGVAGIDVNGEMSWFVASAYVDAMNAHDGGNGWLGINNWRLPSTTVPDPNCTEPIGTIPSTGRNCLLSEMGHLYYAEMGLVSGSNAAGALLAAGFSNVNTGQPYWSATLNAASAYDFFMSAGQQATLSRAFPGHIVPVADVVEAAPVPVMPWVGSAVLGLTLIIAARRKVLS